MVIKFNQRTRSPETEVFGRTGDLLALTLNGSRMSKTLLDPRSLTP